MSSAKTARYLVPCHKETTKANAPPALFFVFAARGRRFPFFLPPSSRRGPWSAGSRQGLARPHQRTSRGSVPRADQGRFARPALGRAPPSAKGLRLPALHQLKPELPGLGPEGFWA